MLAPERYRWRYLLLAGLFCALIPVAFRIDLPVARWAHANGFQHLGELDHFITWSEVFARGFGVGVLLLTVWVLDPAHRRHVLRLGFLSLGAGAIAALMKLTVMRTRPEFANLDGDVFDNFAIGFSSLWNDKVHSFPSGHATTAVGLAIGLSWLYPRGRWLFVFFAVAAATQRWSYRAHFVSDTCGGAVIAFAFASFVLGSSPLQRWLARFEERAARTNGEPRV